VERRSDESIDKLLRRFRSQVAQAQVLRAVKRKRYYLSKSEQRQMARRRAVRRERRRQWREEHQRRRVYRMTR
jgi:small subunit ribosomal protein S21